MHTSTSSNLPVTRKCLQQLRQQWYSSTRKQPFLFSTILPAFSQVVSEDQATLERFCIEVIWAKNVKK